MESFQRVVVGTDGSEHAMVAVERAFSLAKLINKPLVAYFVVETPPFQGFPQNRVADQLTQILREEGERVLDVVRARGKELRVPTEGHALEGRAAEQLCDAATTTDIIVVATHGRRGLGRMLLGSVAENVVRHAPCPVLVVRDPGRRILPPPFSALANRLKRRVGRT